MYREYIEKLIDYLETTTLYDKDGIPYKDYEMSMKQLVEVFTTVKQAGKQVFFIGNGGSAAIASHMTADFMKNGGMKTNDYGYEYIFSRPLEFLADEDDLLIAISSSGNSKNIINAIQVAKKKGCRVITFSGFLKDNAIRMLGDYNLHVPVSHYGMVESIHNLILQQIVDMILERDGECL